MQKKFIIRGGEPLAGEIEVLGAKNVALKALVATLLTDEEVVLENIPSISDLDQMVRILHCLGRKVECPKKHQVIVKKGEIRNCRVDLDMAAHLRASSMVLGPLLARVGEAIVPNPGGCRIGARPIDRHVEGLKKMGATVAYNRDDGYFYMKASKLKGIEYTFEKNTHTGTETLILAAVLGEGTTVLENAAEQPEVDDLVSLLISMGADIKRIQPRKIIIHGKEKLHGTNYTIMSDRNEAVTFAVGAYMSKGNILIKGTQAKHMKTFFDRLYDAGAKWEVIDEEAIRFYWSKDLHPTDVVTLPHPGFMTDWQAPWCLLMTQANGVSTIHETVFEDRFGYVAELRKTGAHINLYNPPVSNPQSFYNFNWSDNKEEYFHAAHVVGPTTLHNGILNITDLRAGATLVLAAIGATGESILHGVEHIDRGYERLDERLNLLGASIQRVID